MLEDDRPARQRPTDGIAPAPLAPVKPRTVQTSTSERDLLFEWLSRGARRLRANDCLRDAARAACALLASAAVYLLLERSRVPRSVLTAIVPFFLFAGTAAIGWLGWRCMQGRSLETVAAIADARCRLNDELISAWWFAREQTPSAWEALLLGRAVRTTSALDVRAVFPLRAPRSLASAAGLGTAVLALMFVGSGTEVPADRSAGVIRSLDVQPRSGDDTEANEIASRARAMAASAGVDESVWNRAEALATNLRSGAELAELKRAIESGDADRVREWVERAAQVANAAAASSDSRNPVGDGMVRTGQDLSAGLPGLPDDGSPPRKNAVEPADRTEDEQAGEKESAPKLPTDRLDTEIGALKDALSKLGEGGGGGHSKEANGTPPGQESQRRGQAQPSDSEALQAVTVASGTGGGEGTPPAELSGTSGEPVQSSPVARLATRMQRLDDKVAAGDSTKHGKESPYTVTEAGTARTGLSAVRAVRTGASDAALAREQIPVAYRASVRRYFLTEHGKER